MDSPIAILNLICVANSISCEYTIISREGQVHSPTFTFRCEVGNYAEEASGQSKKKAKHEVAKKMLKTLLDDQQLKIDNRVEILKKLIDESKPESLDTSTVTQSSKSERSQDDPGDMSKTVKMESNSQDLNSDNPVGRLQEICTKKHWNPPVYDFVDEVGPPHNREFKFVCSIEDMELFEFGQGKSKKTAKRESSQAMLNRLRAENLDRVDEILDRIPKRAGQAPVEASSFDMVGELVKVRHNLNDDWKLKQSFMNELCNNADRLKQLVVILAEPVTKFLERYLQEEKLIEIHPLAERIAKVVDCKVHTAVMPAKNVHSSYDCYTDLVSIDKRFDDVVVATGQATDDQLTVAKAKAVSKAIIMFLALFLQPLSKIEVPETTKSQDETVQKVTDKLHSTSIKPNLAANKAKFPQLNFDDDLIEDVNN